LTGKIRKTGLTLVPIRIYSKGRTVKLELGLGRKKKKFDKREAIKRRETSREIERNLKK
jgi:SsrA-binding protein